MKKNKILPILAIVISIAAMVLSLINKSSLKLGYVDAPKLYSEFNFQKELNAQIESLNTNRMEYLDSIKLGIEILEKKKQLNSYDLEDEERLLFMKSMYNKKVEQFNEEDEQIRIKNNEKIIKRINQYAKDFGKENGYNMIFGVKGDGNIVYSEEQFDVTEKLIDYANKKFKGK